MSDSYPGPGYEYYDRENGVGRHYQDTDSLSQRELYERMRRDQAQGYIGSPSGSSYPTQPPREMCWADEACLQRAAQEFMSHPLEEACGKRVTAEDIEATRRYYAAKARESQNVPMPWAFRLLLMLIWVVFLVVLWGGGYIVPAIVVSVLCIVAIARMCIKSRMR